MVSNLGILAASVIKNLPPSSFTLSTATSFGTAANNSPIGVTFVNGTAILQLSSGTATRYSTNLFDGSNVGGTTVNSPNQLLGANGVALKVGLDTSGTVTISRTTTGGTSWSTVLNTASTSDRMYAIAYGNVGGTARWIAPVFGDNDVYLSTDNGASFTLQSNVLGGTARTWRGALYFGTAFAVFNTQVSAYYTSPNGTTWTLRTLPVTTSNLRHNQVVAGESEVMLLDDTTNGTAVAYTSTDLINWTLAGTITAGTYTAPDDLFLTYGNGYYVAAFYNNSAGTASDWLSVWYSANKGTAWSNADIPSGTGIYDITFAALGYNPDDYGFYLFGGTRLWRSITRR